MTKPNAARIMGTLSLTIDGAPPIDIGKVTLPLVVTHIDNPSTGRMAFGLGVNLEAVRNAVTELFRQAEEPLT